MYLVHKDRYLIRDALGVRRETGTHCQRLATGTSVQSDRFG
jgi:hypothetical protein